MQGRSPAGLAMEYVNAGAPALSVVTESRHFGGSMDLLGLVAGRVQVPVLRKDFITTEEDIRLSRLAGASAVLLIVAQLTPELLRKLRVACREEGLEVLVEAHTPLEIEAALAVEPEMVGINNRDILQLETDSGEVSLTERLSPLVKGKALLVSESGLYSRNDIRRAAEAGAGAALVGTALLRAASPGILLRQFMRVTAP